MRLDPREHRIPRAPASNPATAQHRASAPRCTKSSPSPSPKVCEVYAARRSARHVPFAAPAGRPGQRSCSKDRPAHRDPAPRRRRSSWRAKKSRDQLRGITEHFRREPRHLEHFEAQTHGASGPVRRPFAPVKAGGGLRKPRDAARGGKGSSLRRPAPPTSRRVDEQMVEHDIHHHRSEQRQPEGHVATPEKQRAARSPPESADDFDVTRARQRADKGCEQPFHRRHFQNEVEEGIGPETRRTSTRGERAQ